jgi:hypothetical protein
VKKQSVTGEKAKKAWTTTGWHVKRKQTTGNAVQWRRVSHARAAPEALTDLGGRGQRRHCAVVGQRNRGAAVRAKVLLLQKLVLCAREARATMHARGESKDKRLH